MTEELIELTKILAVEMTARTGELWRADIAETWWTHIYSETAYIMLQLESRPRRLRAIVSEPKTTYRLSNRTECTCDPKRDPANIAADIDRKLISEARSHLLKCYEADKKNKSEKARAACIESLLSQYIPKNWRNELRSETIYEVRISVYSKNKVAMKLSELTPAQAVQIAKILKEN